MGWGGFCLCFLLVSGRMMVHCILDSDIKIGKFF